MKTYEVTAPDGRTFEITAPDNATQDEVLAYAKAHAPQTAKDQVENDAISKGAREKPKSTALDIIGGIARGAGSIGATLLLPIDAAVDAIKGDRDPNLTSLVTGKKPMSRNAERRAEMDAALSNLGADPDSLAFKVAKGGTEVAGTLGVGGVLANGVRAVAGSGKAADIAATALETGGFRTGAKMSLPADVATRAGAGAVTGGASAALVDPHDTGTGTAIGAVLPVAVRGAAAAADAIRKTVRAGASVVSPAAARARATEKIADALGDDAGQTVADIQTHYPKGAEDIPLSAAAITQDARLAQLEQGSRLNNPSQWFEFDQKQGRAVFDNVLRATEESGELADRLARRQDNWRTMWATTAQSLRPRLWMARMTQFGADLEMAMRSPDASNPAVRGVLDAINTEMDRVGPAFSPAHLQQLRANLNGKVQPLSPDVFKSAPRDLPAIKSLISEMDDILNVSTGGKWQKVLETYAADSDLVRAAKAAGKVRGAFVDEATGRVRGVSLDPNGDVPKITEAGLGRALDSARMPDKSLALSGGALARLEATLDALRSQNVVQGVKRTSTAGGGSDTVPNAIAAGAAHAAGAPNLVLQLIGAARKLGTAKTDHELAALLSNPDALADALRPWLSQPSAARALPGGAAARALPVAGAALLAQPAMAGEDGHAAPEGELTRAPHEQTAPTPSPAQKLAQAPNVDAAINAAFEALRDGGAPPDEARQMVDAAVASSPAPQPESAPVEVREAPPPAPAHEGGAQPVTTWSGRRGSGYLDAQAALNALPSRQRANPELRWEVERLQDGRYRLAGYADGQPRATSNESGTLTVQDWNGAARETLKRAGIPYIAGTGGRILVGRSQANAAMQLLEGQ